jgi:predicted DNA-binding protein (MmcQ/YjbR family)
MGTHGTSVETLRRFGLGLPGTREDHPWGELVLKVKDKVFVFLGKPGGDVCGFSVKLPHSGERLLDHDWAEPTGYGLGKSGWVTLTFERAAPLDERELCALLLESYRAVAPKTLVKELDARAAGASAAPPAAAPRARKKAGKSGAGKQTPARKAPARAQAPRRKA